MDIHGAQKKKNIFMFQKGNRTQSSEWGYGSEPRLQVKQQRFGFFVENGEELLQLVSLLETMGKDR